MYHLDLPFRRLCAQMGPGLSWVLCFPCGLGLVGAWLGLFGDQFLRMLFSMTRFRSGRWTKIEV